MGYSFITPDIPDFTEVSKEERDAAVDAWNKLFASFVDLLLAGLLGVVLRWVYRNAKYKFYDTTKKRYLSDRDVRRLLNQYLDAQKAAVDNLSAQVESGDLDLYDWVQKMRLELRQTYWTAYVLGKGGMGQMYEADTLVLSTLLREQYRYLNDFASSFGEGDLSMAQVAARARLYIASARRAFERARVAARGMPELPQYPGDGNTRCGVNCLCTLRFVEFDDHWEVYWERHASESCEDCVGLSEQWNPLVVEKEEADDA